MPRLSLILPLIWSFAYGWPYRRVEAFQALVLRHEIVLVMYPMVIVALVAVLQWDSLYPDRRDAEVLGRLPVPGTTMFWAKASALLVFVGLFALASNGPASLLYPLVANMRSAARTARAARHGLRAHRGHDSAGRCSACSRCWQPWA